MAIYTIRDHDLILDNEERKYILRIRDLPPEDKPREKLVRYGPHELSLEELFAVILNVGSKKEGVLALSSRILKEYGEKSIVSQTNPQKMADVLEIPFVKACQLVVCFEIGRRLFQKHQNRHAAVRSAKEVYHYVGDMRELQKEHLRGIYLNSQYRVIHDEVISIGSLTANVVHPREIFKPAIEHAAAALILVHNHPSGSIKPSDADIVITKQLVEIGNLLGIDVVDHVIVTKRSFCSIHVS